MTADALNEIAAEVQKQTGRSIEECRAAVRRQMYEVARALGVPEVKIQAARFVVGR